MTKAAELKEMISKRLDEKLTTLGVPREEWEQFVKSQRLDYMSCVSCTIAYNKDPMHLEAAIGNMIGQGKSPIREGEPLSIDDFVALVDSTETNAAAFNKVLANYIDIWINGTPNMKYLCEIPFRFLALKFPYSGKVYRGEQVPTNSNVTMNSYSEDKEVAENFAGLSSTHVGKMGLEVAMDSKGKVLELNTTEGFNFTEFVEWASNLITEIKPYKDGAAWQKEIIVFSPLTEGKGGYTLTTSSIFG